MRDGWARLRAAIIITGVGAGVAELILGWVVVMAWLVARLKGTLGDLNVLDSLSGVNSADTRATVLGEPVGDIRVSNALTPGGNNKGHTVGNVANHVVDVVAAESSHGLLATVL